MKNIQKVSNQNLLFPFSFVFQDTKSPQRELSNHVHDYYEIVYVYSGQGTFFIGDVFYRMQQGDVFLIPNNTIHRAMPDKDNPVTSTIIFFSPTLLYNNPVDEFFSYIHLFEETKKFNIYQISLPSEAQQKIEKQLLTIQQEITNEELGAKHASLIILHQIILDLYRIRIKSNAKSRIYNSDWITDILAYINEHLGEALSLTELANKSLVSTSHFSRIFKQKTGMGLIEYLNTKRIIKAKELVLTTTYTVSQIAERCGFESVSHFHRIFKKYLKMTPATYRKSAKKTRNT
ncbi:helix-turn-helix domain-containing protein [Bacillus sp. APMAM]|nr:helix-turn-helix domain-containing protein [Bacillus sp. APMAM]RTZ54341.1 AraC family transcriptional regulator [Bacillus sp. SAJ1]